MTPNAMPQRGAIGARRPGGIMPPPMAPGSAPQPAAPTSGAMMAMNQPTDTAATPTLGSTQSPGAMPSGPQSGPAVPNGAPSPTMSPARPPMALNQPGAPSPVMSPANPPMAQNGNIAALAGGGNPGLAGVDNWQQYAGAPGGQSAQPWRNQQPTSPQGPQMSRPTPPQATTVGSPSLPTSTGNAMPATPSSAAAAQSGMPPGVMPPPRMPNQGDQRQQNFNSQQSGGNDLQTSGRPNMNKRSQV